MQSNSKGEIHKRLTDSSLKELYDMEDYYYESRRQEQQGSEERFRFNMKAYGQKTSSQRKMTTKFIFFLTTYIEGSTLVIRKYEEFLYSKNSNWERQEVKPTGRYKEVVNKYGNITMWIESFVEWDRTSTYYEKEYKKVKSLRSLWSKLTTGNYIILEDGKTKRSKTERVITKEWIPETGIHIVEEYEPYEEVFECSR